MYNKLLVSSIIEKRMDTLISKSTTDCCTDRNSKMSTCYSSSTDDNIYSIVDHVEHVDGNDSDDSINDDDCENIRCSSSSPSSSLSQQEYSQVVKEQEDDNDAISTHHHRSLTTMLLLVATTTFMIYCLVSSISRPINIIIERKSRPFQSRRIFCQDKMISRSNRMANVFSWNTIVSFIGKNDKKRGLHNYYDNQEEEQQQEWNNKYYHVENAYQKNYYLQNSYNNNHHYYFDDDNKKNNNMNVNNQYQYYHAENAYKKNYHYYQGGKNNNNDDGDDGVNQQQEEANDDYINNNNGGKQYNYYNKNQNYHYYNQADDDNDGNDDGNYGDNNNDNSTYYQEQIIDDFFRYIDDNIEIYKFFPMEFRDYAGLVCTALSIILSIGGGIGPGAILVAVFIIVMDVKPKSAIPLSCITGLGVTTLATFLNMQKRHPLSDRPLIDWDLILIMEPLVLFGAIAGTYINKTLNQRILVVLLVLLLSIIAHNTLKKARKMHHLEELYIKRTLWAKQKKKSYKQPILATLTTVQSYEGKLAEADPPFIPKIHQQPILESSRKAANQQHLLPSVNENEQSIPNEDSNSIPSDSSYSNSFQSFIILRKEDAESVKSSLIEEEADPLPQNKITYIFTMFLGVISFNVFKGGAGFESPLGINCGSWAFWTVELMTTTWLGFCAILAARYLLKRHAIKEAVGFDYVRGDIKWDVRTIVIYPAACVVAGLVSGMFGIGCAVLLAPMLVGIGVNPQVAAATCACMNFFTSLAATSSFVVLGSLTVYHQYAITFFFVGILSLIFGKWVMSFSLHSTKLKKNKRLERHSYMAYSMGLVVLVSALSMTVEALLDVVNHTYGDDEMDGICDFDPY